MIDIPEQHGGLGLDKATSMLVVGARRQVRVVQRVVGRAHRHRHAAARLLRHRRAEARSYLPKLASGEMLAAYALTEPGSGSDALARARPRRCRADGRRLPLTGVKQFITNAGFADLFTVFAKVDGEKFTAFLVERSVPRRLDRPRGAEARHQGLVDAPADPRGRRGAGRPTCSARSAAATRSPSTS